MTSWNDPWDYEDDADDISLSHPAYSARPPRETTVTGLIDWTPQNCFKLGRLLSVDNLASAIELSGEILTGQATPAGDAGDYGGDLGELAEEGRLIEQEYESQLNDLADTLSRASTREQQREREDADDAARRSGPRHGRRSSEETIERAMSRIAAGTFVLDSAIIGEPTQRDTAGRFTAEFACGVPDPEFGYCRSVTHEPGCLHNGYIEADEAGQLRPRLDPEIRSAVQSALGRSYNTSAVAPMQTGNASPRTPAHIRAAFQRSAHSIEGGNLFGTNPDSIRSRGQANLDRQALGLWGSRTSRTPPPSRGHREVRDPIDGRLLGVTAR